MASPVAGTQSRSSNVRIARLLLPFGWVLTTIGYYGPWIAHRTAALTLTGSDMGEFVKFLPGVLDGSLQATRQLFYLPPVAVVFSVALLVGNRILGYSPLLWVAAIALAVVVSVQLLPPAWSPASLVTSEFRLQLIALGLCWLALVSYWLLGRLPIRLTALACCGLAATAGVLSTWQLLSVKPAISATYGVAPEVGWGYLSCLVGLVIVTAGGMALVLSPVNHNREPQTRKSAS